MRQTYTWGWGFSVLAFWYHACFLPNRERAFFVGSFSSCVVGVVRVGCPVPSKKDRTLHCSQLVKIEQETMREKKAMNFNFL